MPAPFSALFARYGYAVVGGGVFLENAGVPLPGETVLLAAGFLAERGTFSLPLVIAVATAAAILGDNLGFWIGRRFGGRLARRYGRLAALEGYFRRHGAKTVFFQRFITGIRVVGAIVAGMSGFPWPRFLVWQSAGAVTWATAIALAGYLFGESWDLLERWMGVGGLVVLGVFLALVAIAWVRLRRRPDAGH